MEEPGASSRVGDELGVDFALGDRRGAGHVAMACFMAPPGRSSAGAVDGEVRGGVRTGLIPGPEWTVEIEIRAIVMRFKSRQRFSGSCRSYVAPVDGIQLGDSIGA